MIPIIIFLVVNGEHAIGMCLWHGFEALRNLRIPLLLKLFQRLDYQIVAVLVASQLRNCAVSLKLFELRL